MAPQVLSRTRSILSSPNFPDVFFLSLVFYPRALFLSTVVYPAVLDFLTAAPAAAQPPIPDDTTAIWTFIAFFLSDLITSTVAVGSITHTTLHGFHARPVTRFASFKLGLTSFFPLLGTAIITQVLYLLNFVAFHRIGYFGVRIGECIPHFAAAAAVAVFVYLQLQWSLASAVVAAESTWGFGALIRSWRLVKGLEMKRVVLGLVLGYGLLTVGLSAVLWRFNLGPEVSIGWKFLGIDVLLALARSVLMIAMLFYTAAITVCYCTAAETEVAEKEVAYVKLGVEDGNK